MKKKSVDSKKKNKKKITLKDLKEMKQKKGGVLACRTFEEAEGDTQKQYMESP